MIKSKRGRGRPRKSAEEHGKQLTVYLPPDVIDWLKLQPDGISKTLANLARRAMAK